MFEVIKRSVLAGLIGVLFGIGSFIIMGVGILFGIGLLIGGYTVWGSSSPLLPQLSVP